MKRRRQRYPILSFRNTTTPTAFFLWLSYDYSILFLISSVTLIGTVNCFALRPPLIVVHQGRHRLVDVVDVSSTDHRAQAAEHHHLPVTATRKWRRQRRSFSLHGAVLEDDDSVMDDDDDDEPFVPVQLPDDYFESTEIMPYDLDDLQQLTVSELKQQLRLRNLKVSGRKDELLQRLLHATSSSPFSDGTSSDGAAAATSRPAPAAAAKEEVASKTTVKATKKQPKTGERRKQEDTFVDVSAYLDPDDQGRQVKTATIGSVYNEDPTEDDSLALGGAEVWGADARIVDDYEGRRVVVDCLSRTVVEFTGSNQTSVPAYCVASREALKPFLAGGEGGAAGVVQKTKDVTATTTTTSSPVSATSAAAASEERLRKIQTQREQASRRAIHWEDESGLDEGDETGIFKDILNRDFSDWGKYTPTGAHLSASEVQGVLLLSDIYGAFAPDTHALAEKIAFECQPVVVLVPDLFRGEPWTGPTDGRNNKGQSFEEWRAGHSDLRVNVDIRAAAACLRERYGCSSVVVWGTCYGGGRALEVASGWLPDDGNIHDIDGSIGPPPVDPMACVAWYPTCYSANDLFGKSHKGTTTTLDGTKRQMAVMAVFAGNDNIPGATGDDAAALKALLEQDDRVKDHMVKTFPGQDHGFAHRGISQISSDLEDPFDRFVDEEFGGAGRVSMGGSDAEVACLLSTAFMETYSRVFLPTVGPPISMDEHEVEWSNKLEMKDLSKSNTRDVRQEIQEALDNFIEEPLSGRRIDPTDPSQEEELKKLLLSMQDPSADTGTNAAKPDDDLATIYAKLIAQDDTFQLF